MACLGARWAATVVLLFLPNQGFTYDCLVIEGLFCGAISEQDVCTYWVVSNVDDPLLESPGRMHIKLMMFMMMTNYWLINETTRTLW